MDLGHQHLAAQDFLAANSHLAALAAGTSKGMSEQCLVALSSLCMGLQHWAAVTSSTAVLAALCSAAQQAPIADHCYI